MYRVNSIVKFAFIGLSLGLMGQTVNCKEFKTILEVFEKNITPSSGSGGGKVYIANRSFMDTETKSVLNLGDAEPLNEAVQAGMTALAAADPKFVVNDPKKTIPNNDTNSKKLSDIYWDANLTRQDKIDKIVNELMMPNEVDGLLFGQVTEKADTTYSVRPIGLSRSTKNMVTESLVFSKTEFKCKDPNGTKMVLCDKARENIKDAVMRVMKNL